MRIVMVQVGDYKEAYERLRDGGGETYGNQKRSVEAVGELVSTQREVIVICARAQPYDTMLDNGVRAIGHNEHAPNGQAKLLNLVQSLKPTHLVVRGPRTEIISYGIKAGIEVLPIFADSFNRKSFRQHLRTRKLVKLLNNAKIRTVSNHNINASRSLCALGVDDSKVVPYDYDRGYSPDQYEPKTGPTNQTTISMVYVGVISEPKGTFDVLDAIPILDSMGIRTELTVIGDHQGALDSAIKKLGLADRVHLKGKLPNAQVLEEMRLHDAVIVPSQHRYPEGLPHTIFESLATRTPLIASDHPMFTPVLNDGETCVMFEAGNAQSIADATQRLLNTRGLYLRISSNTQIAWEKLCVPLNWEEVVTHWLANTPESQKELDRGSVQAILAHK